MHFVVFPIVALVAYLMGSIPSGFLAGKARGIDLRKEGSGNIGATNALRVLGKKLGYLVFAADFLKAYLAVKVGMGIAWALLYGQAVEAGVVAAFFAVVGHMFPVWLGFRGGKGIASSAGVMLALFPWPVFAFGLVVWLVLFFTTRYVSVASIGAAVSLPTSAFTLALFGLCHWLLVVVAAIMCLLAVWRHQPNIQRLIRGTEKKFDRRKARTA